MEYRQLGATGVKVSAICLGTMTFGEADETSMMHQIGADERTSFSMMDRAVERGVNFFDSADIYGQDGLSERVVGKWFAQSRKRDQVVLATKFRFRTGPGPNGAGASRFRIVRTVEDSLRRLQTDRIDLYQIHMQDLDTPEEETLRALDDLVRAGKVLYIGASNYAAYRLVHSLWTSRDQRVERFVTLQAQYSLLSRELEREHIPACRQFNVGVLAWSPLAGGFLSGKYFRDQPPPAGTRYAKRRERWSAVTDRQWSVIETVRAVARELGATSTQVALAWLLRRPQLTSAIIGARDIPQLFDSLASTDLQIPPDTLRRLDEASSIDYGHPYDFMGRVQNRW
jgi:aryl-alcohol dehydrogenase-like predicted oxidoreductase